MKIKYLQWAGALALLAGCATASHLQLKHDVQVVSHTNAFQQTQQIAAWSTQWYVDDENNQWPTGLTLSAQAVQYADGRRARVLILRNDELSRHQGAAAYRQAREEQKRLSQQCATVSLVHDEHALVVPVTSITVRALARSGLMPVPPTDTDMDPVETMVRKNSSDSFVLSTKAQANIGNDTWQKLATAQSLDYDLCGQTASASQAELKGLQQVIRQFQHLGKSSPGS